MQLYIEDVTGVVVESNKFICDGLVTSNDKKNLLLVTAAKNAFPRT